MEVEEIKRVRLSKLEELTQHKIDPYGSKFNVTGSVADTLKDFQENKQVVLAGRLMGMRSHGKVMFADLQDQSGKMQLFIKVDAVKTNDFEIVKALDIGDIIGVKGELFVTKVGQQRVRVNEIIMLSKSLMTMPEKCLAPCAEFQTARSNAL
jgi:lysyl-tRNA synthetase class 2